MTPSIFFFFPFVVNYDACLVSFSVASCWYKVQIMREGCKRSEWEEEGWGWCGVELTLKLGPAGAEVKSRTRGLHTIRDF